jgi:glycosyltransferase involved in cell wall biosynthesis
MRFHVLAVPHTVTNKDYVACAFTQKVLKFCEMMTDRGHDVIHYGHQDSVVRCTEHVTVIDRDTYNRVYGDYDWHVQNFKYDLTDEAYQTYNRNAIREIQARQSPNDFVLAFWGQGNKAVCDALSGIRIVEPGIGYSQAFAPFRVYESYALMHANMGLDRVQYSGNMPWYHVVIPNYFDPKDFEYSETKKDYYLYLGRITTAKGLQFAIDVTNELGVRLVVAGQGGPSDVGLEEWPSHVEYVGYANADRRRELLRDAKALFVMSTYVEPFAGVMIESFLSGTPVISTDWGTFSENNLHGLTGYRCRTYGQMVWAAQNIHMIDPKACRTWGENFTSDKVAPMYEEYFRTILDGWYDSRSDRYQLDWLTRKYPTVQPPKTIDAFFQCYNQVYAADKAFESYRKCYPTGKVVMLNDGGDPAMEMIAKKYGAEYEYKPNIGICHWKKPTEWLERFFDAVKRLESDYFVMQEEDVQHRRPVDQTKLVFDICGTNPDAKFPAEITEYIQRETGRICTNYSASGGCFFRTEFFKRLAETNWRTHIQHVPPQWLWADVAISFVTCLYGGTIGYCSECVELGRPEYDTYKSPAVVHQYKVHYETPLCALAYKYGADKCPRIHHSYTPVYHSLLEKRRTDIQSVLEIGIGNAPLMTEHVPKLRDRYTPGASMRMWRDYFQSAHIHACDILPEVLFEEDRITTSIADQSSTESLKSLTGPYDLILDDGSHQKEHMVTSFRALWDSVKPGGLYIIEDIPGHFLDEIIALAPDSVVHVHRGPVMQDDTFVAFEKKTTKTLWVTSYRNLHREKWQAGHRTVDDYITWFDDIKTLPGLVCFVDEPEATLIRERTGFSNILPYDIDDTFIPKFTTRQTEILKDPWFVDQKFQGCPEYIHADYSLTLCAKACFIRRAAELFPDFTHYAWIDFGYSRDGDPVPTHLEPVVPEQIYISSFRDMGSDENGTGWISEYGDKDTRLEYTLTSPFQYLKKNFYAIQGNMFFVPKKFTKWVEQEFDRVLTRNQELGVVVGHDEPTWLSIIHDFRNRFKINVKTEWRSNDWFTPKV